MRAAFDVWNREEGWGVLVSSELAADGIWFHFSVFERDGYFQEPLPGQIVEAEVEGPLPFDQDGYRYRATFVRPGP
jgi:cold shock CspA family protein